MSPRPPSAGSYARAIEQVLGRVRGAPVLLSPRDFGFVSDWHARGVPLAILVESIEAAAAPRRGRSKRPRRITLAYVAAAVEEAWGVVLAGRTAAPRGPRARAGGTAPIRDRWVAALERAGAKSALGHLLGDAVRHLDEGQAAGAIDRALDDALAAAAPADVLRAIESRVDAELLGFAARMSPAELGATRRRAIVDRLRQTLDLPRLAGHGAAQRESLEPR